MRLVCAVILAKSKLMGKKWNTGKIILTTTTTTAATANDPSAYSVTFLYDISPECLPNLMTQLLPNILKHSSTHFSRSMAPHVVRSDKMRTFPSKIKQNNQCISVCVCVLCFMCV